ncbi:universal stress protein [Vagococcus elongatus]|uniref:Universal stress protein n=1 Tax=Vagococcus elongatus TaxID=180344 RepID=A0A430ALZ5_9ENTE|nr:universal stress protein [Vagococcus elongatus]RSU09128.1 universal stress protein UspA [Vagococcus elongatus]
MKQKYQRILVAVDGSETAELALAKAIHIAKQNSAKLVIAHVIDTRAFQNISSYDDDMAERASVMAQQTLEEYLQLAKERGVKNVEGVIEFGSVKKILAHELPEKYHIDLILLGATGLNLVERFLLGSVSQYVVRHTTCDVLIVKDKDAQPEKTPAE